MMEKRYFEIELSNNNDIDRSTEGCDLDCSICIVGSDYPSIEEAQEFCKKDMVKLGYKFVVSITEITKDEAFVFLNMENEESLPVFSQNIEFGNMNRINQELKKYNMAYKIEDKEGNIFVYAGIENNIPIYRINRGQKHISDLTGFKVIEHYVNTNN